MSKRLLNPLWEHFTEPTLGLATCVHCKQTVSRGSPQGHHQNTTNMWRHLEGHHTRIFKETKKRKEDMARGAASTHLSTETKKTKEELSRGRVNASEQPSTLSPGVTLSLDKWKQHNPKSKRLDKLILEMCATDDLPFSVVLGPGFQRLLHELQPKYNVRSDMFSRSDSFEVLYKTVQTAVRMLMAGRQRPPPVSFTVACSPGATEALMSLSAHFIDELWQHRRVVLHVKAMSDANTVEYVHQFFLPLLKFWSVKQRRVFLLLRDGGADVSEEDALNEVSGLGCCAHSLQSAVEAAISNHPDAADAIAKVRTCAEHFRDSILAKQRLRKIQHELNLPQSDLQVDEPLSWLRTLQMLKCALEQRRALNCYTQIHNAFSTPASGEWDLIRAITETLSTVEEVSREMRDSGSSLSCVIPSVSVLKLFLQSQSITIAGARELQLTLLRGLEQRFNKLEETKVLVLATLLDPRYKCNVLTPELLRVAPKWLSEEHVARLALQEEQGEEDEEVAEVQKDSVKTEVEQPSGDLVEQMFASILGSSPPVVEHKRPELSGQLQQYLSEPLIDRSADPLAWWKTNASQFDLLAPLARKLLSAPPSSVLGEETAGRNCASGEHAEKLFFLKHNLPLIRYQY